MTWMWQNSGTLTGRCGASEDKDAGASALVQKPSRKSVCETEGQRPSCSLNNSQEQKVSTSVQIHWQLTPSVHTVYELKKENFSSNAINARNISRSHLSFHK